MSTVDPEPLAAATLQEVIPVVEQLQCQDVAVSVMTLERYSTGFVVNIRVDWRGPTGPMPHLRWRVSDGHATTFIGGGCGGSGGGEKPNIRPMLLARGVPIVGRWLARKLEARPRGHSWRMHCSFWPAVSPEATALTLELTSTGLSRPILSETEPDTLYHWESERTLSNMGEITIPLRPASQR